MGTVVPSVMSMNHSILGTLATQLSTVQKTNCVFESSYTNDLFPSKSLYVKGNLGVIYISPGLHVRNDVIHFSTRFI